MQKEGRKEKLHRGFDVVACSSHLDWIPALAQKSRKKIAARILTLWDAEWQEKRAQSKLGAQPRNV